MNTITAFLRREARVAFSLRVQPLWFRVLKWLCILAGVVLFHDRPLFWWCLAALAGAGIALHFFFRWKTGGWKRPWGGWNDLEAGHD